MKKKFATGLIALFFISGFQLTAEAASITSDLQLTGSKTIIDFSQFTGSNEYNNANGPVQIGSNVGLDVTASSGNNSLWLYNQSWGLSGNGTWGSGRNGYLGIWPNDGPVTINFTNAISGFGVFMNYVVEQGYSSVISISAFDSSNALLETYNVLNDPISTPSGTNAGGFRGILRNSSDIAHIQFYGQGIVLDDLTFQSDANPVPEPATMLLFGTGIAGLAAVGRRKRS